MKYKIVQKVLIGVCGIFLAVSVAGAAPANLTIATNASGSQFYLLGSGLAKLFQKKLKIRATAQPNTGSSVYLPMVNAGQIALGVSGAVDAAIAYHGEHAYPQKMENIRTLAKIWVLPYAYVVRGNSGIKSVEDLKGKRVMGNMPSNVALTAINKAILATGGLSPDDVNFAVSGGLISGIQAVVQGRADAAPVATMMPILSQSDNSVPGGLRIVSNGHLATDEFYGKQLPGVRVQAVEPTPSQPYIRGETNVAAYDVLLVGSADMPGETVKKIVKTLYENWPDLQKDYAALRDIQRSEIAPDSPAVPYHPAAEDYFKEIGLIAAAR